MAPALSNFVLQLASFSLTLLLLPSAFSAAADPHGPSITLPIANARPLSSIHTHTLLDLASADDRRARFLSGLDSSAAVAKRRSAPVAAGRQVIGYTGYVVRAALGTPPQELLFALDIASDAAWLPCSGCSGCPASAPPFASGRSSTFMPVRCGDTQCGQVPGTQVCKKTTNNAIACGFNMTYGSSTIEAALSKDTLTIAGDAFPSYTFGCLTSATGISSPPQGLLGLGRGPLSLMSQTRATHLATFSYCLPSFRSANFSGSLRLGPGGQPLRIRFTPLLLNPHRPSLYYLNMTGVRIGRRVVNIPPSSLVFDPATGAGTVLDTGTMFTRLVAPAYVAVRDAFRRRVKGNVTSLGGFDTCYTGPIFVPTVAFLFDGGLNVSLPADNVLIRSTAGNLACLAMAAAVPDPVNRVVNVIAAMQQQNLRVLVDVPNGRVGVARELCTARPAVF